MRIAIVNDMRMAVAALQRVVTSVPDYEVAWIAHNGSQAVTQCEADIPDLILMDMIMSEVDGVEATRLIMEHFPCAILIVTASIKKNSSKIFEAMGYGALDVVNTPVLGRLGQPEAAQVLLDKIATIGVLIGQRKSKMGQVKESIVTVNGKPKSKLSTPSSTLPPLVVIGASTGGPKALSILLSELPTDFRAAIVIIQHVDAQFAPGLAKWLDKQTALTVRLASEGDFLQSGTVLLAGTNDHLVLRPNLTLKYTSKPQDYPYRPSVDAFCQSIVDYWHRKGTAVLLTGMGKDGAVGLKELRAKGWHTIAQDQQTCVVYGMPKAAVEMDAAVEILPLSEIALALIRRVSTTS